MSQRLDNTVGACVPDNLINSPTPPADVFSVKLAAGQGVLARGTLLGLKADGSMVVMGTEGEGITANAVLTDAVDTGDAGATGTVTATAYRTGHFNRNKLIVKSGYTLKAADEEELRKCGILLSDAFAG